MLKEYKTEDIRNVAIIGHGSTGKSTLFDSMLMVSGKIDKLGNPDNGTLTSDFDDDEKERKISIRSAMGYVELDGVKINILDTPGTADFVGESRAALQAVETAILVVDSVDGVQIETEKWWRYLEENNIPRIIFVNKMDKERANFDEVMKNIKTGLKTNVAALCIPNGEGESVNGVVDVVNMKLMQPKGDGKSVDVSDIPDDMKDIVEVEKLNLTELAAESDDDLIEKFLEGDELTDEEIRKGLKIQVSNGKLHPVICGTSTKVIGIKNLLQVIKDFAPAPFVGRELKGFESSDMEKEKTVKIDPNGPFAAVVWKTYIDQYSGRANFLKVVSGELIPDMDIVNSSKNDKERAGKIYTMLGQNQEDVPKLCCGDIGVIIKLNNTSTKDTICDPKNNVVLPIIELPEPVFSYAIYSEVKGDQDKISQFFNRITDENPTLSYEFNAETKETVFSGMGEIQLNIILNNLKEKNKINVITQEPRVAYRETVTKQTEAQYKHKKQSGGHGQYGEVYIRMKPQKRGDGFEFKDSIVGGVVPKSYIPGVQKGLTEALNEGILAKFPVVDVWIELFDGSYHAVDSSEMSFKIAARNAFKKAMEAAGPQILEPVMEVSIFVDKDYMGDILNDITSRRGKVLGMENAEDSGGGISVVKATVPLAEMLRYTIDLRAMTSGKATFEMKFSHYDPISGRVADKIIEARQKQFEDEANK